MADLAGTGRVGIARAKEREQSGPSRTGRPLEERSAGCPTAQYSNPLIEAVAVHVVAFRHASVAEPIRSYSSPSIASFPT
jgi:hypothetical protein